MKACMFSLMVWKSIKGCSAWHLGFVAEWRCHSYNSVSSALRVLRVRDRSGGNHIRAEPHGAWWIRSTSTNTTSAHHARPGVCNWGEKQLPSVERQYRIALSHTYYESTVLVLSTGSAAHPPGGGPKPDSKGQLHGGHGEGEERSLRQDPRGWHHLPEPHHQREPQSHLEWTLRGIDRC